MHSSPFNMQAKPDQPSAVAPYLGPVMVPFPELSTTIPTSKPGSQYKAKKQFQSLQKKHVQIKSRDVPKRKTSAPIPFPEAHVRRTPSEHQLDLNERQAEYNIMKMNDRVALGKRLRAQVHTSAQKPVKGKEAGTEEQQQQVLRKRGNGGWDLAYVSIDGILDSRRSVKHTADKLEGGDDKDDFIFSLDL